MKYLKLILLLYVTTGISLYLQAYNISRISSRDGLSSSAVICMLQDKERYLWVGTYDGLNKYNGTDIQIYKPDIRNKNSLSGNVIRKIVESKDGYLWIMTKGGLNKFSKKKDHVEAFFSQFQEDCSMACDSLGNFFILTQTGKLFYYDFTDGQFEETAVPGFHPTRNWVSLIIDSENQMWITNSGESIQYSIRYTGDQQVRLQRNGVFKHPLSISYIYYSDDKLIVIDTGGDLYIVGKGEKKRVCNISEAIARYGDITSIVFDDDDIVIGFRTNGVIRLIKNSGYALERIPINCGVFSLLKDDTQDILWVATDGQGLYACLQEGFVFEGINLDELPLKKQRPVRAIYNDVQGDLWLGTKGNGIVRIKDFENVREYDRQHIVHYTVDNGLSNNEVFSFEMSRNNKVLWIGTSGTQLNYYSFSDNRIHTLKNNTANVFIEVHSIMETSDTTLWVASLFSLYKVNIHKTGSSIEARSIRKYEFDIRNKQRYNKIYSICRENDSIFWLAMRGNGAIRFNSRTGAHRLFTFDEGGIAPMNDILSMHISKEKQLWMGTSYGFNNLKPLSNGRFKYRNYNENDGLINNTIHGILENKDGRLWLSSNAGITLFDPAKNTFRNFNQKSGIKVIEFSDNAYYKDEETSRYFFGGIDGVVWIKHGESSNNNFTPPVYFTKLRILNEEANINDFLVSKKNRSFLRFKHNQNFFTVSFSTNNFIEGASIKFSYMLENFNKVWMNSNAREAQFTNIPPGEYVLKVKYNKEFEEESQIAELNIVILPPWYLSIYAKLFYVLAVMGMLYFLYVYLTRKYESKRLQLAHELDQKYKEEMYENKLRFFTNITHEFCTPLTLIHSPSERILNYEGSDQYIKKYAHIIKSNVESLNNLIQEIIDFRRMETGHKTVKVEKCNINEICGEMMEAFTDMAEENHIRFTLQIPPDVTWNSDKSCLTKIMNNLISNAFKYTAAGGNVSISVDVDSGELVLRVYNSGKGIREEDMRLMFNRYSILDNIKQNSIKGLSSRNGLGLAICKSMVELLDGKIEIESQIDQYAEFIVRLPVLEIAETENTRQEKPGKAPVIMQTGAEKRLSGLRVDTDGKDEKKKSETEMQPRILIVDDNEEILWILSDILSKDYIITTAGDGYAGFEQLTNAMPDLVITDIMMPNLDGISLIKRIKLNPNTMHIPIVIISAKSAIDDRIEGIASGADAYVSKPFDTQYMTTVVAQLIQKHRKLREYYNSSASAFDYVNGQLMSKDDRDFVKTVIQVIDQHISEVEFNPEDLAENLRISLRSLYRKFKDLDLLPPKDFIKKQRVEYSAKLLISTNLTIQEIMYHAGFTTRSHFHKEFTKRFSQSPREYRSQHGFNAE
jgi:signal transduction histidine kinase/ligand-binding sensor domain-containing protein/CheY-like chemotaxis protein/AraC-like DNA-binding protein